MTYKSVRFENIGPIAAGEVRRHPISVFIGPAGAGKSIAARMICGVFLLDAPGASRRPDPRAGGIPPAGRNAARAGRLIAESAGISIASVPTHMARSSSLEVATDARRTQKIDYAKLGSQPAPAGAHRPLPHAPGGGRSHCMYVPAGRPGIVRSCAGMAHVGSARPGGSQGGCSPPCSEAQGGGPPVGKGRPRASPALGDPAPPEYLVPFYDAVFRSLEKRPTAAGARMLSRIFGGSVSGPADSGAPTATYTSSDGFEDEITSAASGVLSSFPVAECAASVKKGGLLVVEEPEAHLDPMKQLLLVEELARAARAAPFDLVLITHSDHTLDSVQSLVASEKMGRDDLGLYYFERKGGSHTRIRPVPVNEDGTAEQEMFEDAIDLLGKRFI